MSLQKYERLYDYIYEYQRLVYNFYSKDGIAFLVTYYHINSDETIWENENINNGAYERVGNLSGIKWDKILLLPVYFIDEVSTSFDAQDIGYIKDNETSFVIPSTYGFVPLPNDKIKFDQKFLQNKNDIYPLFNVGGIEKSVNTEITFWKIKIKIEQSISINLLEQQLNNIYTFFEYDKKIHTVEDALYMTNLLNKNNNIKKIIKDNFYDKQSGFYFK